MSNLLRRDFDYKVLNNSILMIDDYNTIEYPKETVLKSLIYDDKLRYTKKCFKYLLRLKHNIGFVKLFDVA